MEWNLQGDIDSTLLLKALKVSNALSRCLNLDGKCSNHCNDVKRIAKDPILWKGGIEFQMVVVVSMWVVCVTMFMKSMMAKLTTWARQGKQFWLALKE